MTIETKSLSALEVFRLDPLTENVPLEAWQALCDSAIDPNPFFGPGFLLPFLERMARRSVHLMVVSEKDTGKWLIAAPVGRRRLGLALPVNTTWATEYAPLGTPLMHPASGEKAVQAFLVAAAEPAGTLAIPYLPLESETARRLMGTTSDQITVAAESERASHAAGPAGDAQLAEAFTGKRRKEMRRLLRRLADHGEVRFVTLEGDDVPAGFEAFLELEKGGWKGRSGTALLSQSQTATFAREAIRNRSEAKGVRIDQLWAGDTLVAALVLFREQGRVFSWKIAFDEQFARFSPGAQIALQAFRQNLAQSGFEEADSLAIPGHSMIEPLWRGRLRTGTVLFGNGSLSGLRQALCAADLTMEQTLRQIGRAAKKQLGAYTSARA